MTDAAQKTYEVGRWSLDDLFPGIDSSEVKAAFETLEAFGDNFESWREKLTADMDFEEFMDCIDSQEKHTRIIGKVFQYSYLNFSGDTQDAEAQNFMAKVQQFNADLENKVLFFSLWWKSIDDDAADRLMKDAGDYKYWLQRIRNMKPYTLSEPEEKIINTKNVTGEDALKNIYSSLTNRYVFKVEVEGEVKEMTRGELMTLVQGPAPDLRAAAYQELYRVYGEEGNILGQIYQARVRDYYNENVGMRKISSTISVRNLANDIPDEVVDTLLDVAKKNTGIFQKYFKLKAKWIGMDKLRRYDVYAPVAASDKEVSFNDATHMVFESFELFDSEIAKMANRVYEDDHIDSEVRKGKLGGAFNSGVDPDLTPWVLINYNKRVRDISTLAHELGHAVHNMLAEQHNVFTSHAPLPLAETASTFAQMLLTDKLLAEEKDEAVRRDILVSQVDDAYATIMRQTFFALFEREAHDLIQEGASVDDLNQAYIKNLETQFGDSLEIGEEFKWEWVSIPHIYDRPFYVYAYAFGQLLVLALYQIYKEEGESFIPRYKEILAAGGSMSPMDILDKAGVDVRKPEFWQGGFDVISSIIDRLEEME